MRDAVDEGAMKVDDAFAGDVAGVGQIVERRGHAIGLKAGVRAEQVRQGGHQHGGSHQQHMGQRQLSDDECGPDA